MLRKEVVLGRHYAIKHDGRLSVIRIDGPYPYGNGWNATKLKTGRTIRIKSATKLRFEVVQDSEGKWVKT